VDELVENDVVVVGLVVLLLEDIAVVVWVWLVVLLMEVVLVELLVAVDVWV